MKKPIIIVQLTAIYSDDDLSAYFSLLPTNLEQLSSESSHQMKPYTLTIKLTITLVTNYNQTIPNLKLHRTDWEAQYAPTQVQRSSSSNAGPAHRLYKLINCQTRKHVIIAPKCTRKNQREAIAIRNNPHRIFRRVRWPLVVFFFHGAANSELFSWNWRNREVRGVKLVSVVFSLMKLWSEAKTNQTWRMRLIIGDRSGNESIKMRTLGLRGNN